VQGSSSFASVGRTLMCDHSNESYWAVVLCSSDEVILTFKSVDETPKCNHSNRSWWVVLTASQAVQGSSFIESLVSIMMTYHLNESYQVELLYK